METKTSFYVIETSFYVFNHQMHSITQPITIWKNFIDWSLLLSTKSESKHHSTGWWTEPKWLQTIRVKVQEVVDTVCRGRNMQVSTSAWGPRQDTTESTSTQAAWAPLHHTTVDRPQVQDIHVNTTYSNSEGLEELLIKPVNGVEVAHVNNPSRSVSQTQVSPYAVT